MQKYSFDDNPKFIKLWFLPITISVKHISILVQLQRYTLIEVTWNSERLKCTYMNFRSNNTFKIRSKRSQINNVVGVFSAQLAVCEY